MSRPVSAAGPAAPVAAERAEIGAEEKTAPVVAAAVVVVPGSDASGDDGDGSDDALPIPSVVVPVVAADGAGAELSPPRPLRSSRRRRQSVLCGSSRYYAGQLYLGYWLECLAATMSRLPAGRG